MASWSVIQGQGRTGTPPSGGNQPEPESGAGNQPDSGAKD